ncbi:MAG: hypothetical protein OJJ54_18540 [Pseudonocardia sp.]|nr:hypothetical protein [Pseudonocardia sp.]
MSQAASEQGFVAEPALPDEIKGGELDTEVRRDLRGLQKETAEKVARHLVAAGMLVDEEPQRALEHARYARRRASRIAVVREAAGIVAYHAGEWTEALGELRAARRMGGGPGHIAVMADIERALGRPERALELARGPEAKELDRAARIELAIVAAGARRDLGEIDAAVVGLQVEDLDPKRRDPWSPRLFYAYADNLLAAGRESDALQWFVHTANADVDAETDALTRIAELTGEELPEDGEDDVVFGVEDRAAPVSAPPRDAEVAPAAAEPLSSEAEGAELSDDAEVSDEAGEPAAAEKPDVESPAEAEEPAEVPTTAEADATAEATADADAMAEAATDTDAAVGAEVTDDADAAVDAEAADDAGATDTVVGSDVEVPDETAEPVAEDAPAEPSPASEDIRAEGDATR